MIDVRWVRGLSVSSSTLVFFHSRVLRRLFWCRRGPNGWWLNLQSARDDLVDELIVFLLGFGRAMFIEPDFLTVVSNSSMSTASVDGDFWQSAATIATHFRSFLELKTGTRGYFRFPSPIKPVSKWLHRPSVGNSTILLYLYFKVHRTSRGDRT